MDYKIEYIEDCPKCGYMLCFNTCHECETFWGFNSSTQNNRTVTE